MKKGGLYIIWLSDRHYYGGRTVDFVSRWQVHRNLLRKGVHTNPHAQAVYNIYGVFKPEILVELPAEDQVEAETVWLKENFGKPECLNVWNSAQGAHRGWRHSEETKAKFRARVCSDETHQKLRDARSRRVFTAETKAKISSSNKGKKRPYTAERNIANTGWKHTDEAKAKIASSSRSRTHQVSDETRLKISESLKGRRPSEETLRKRAESLKKSWVKRKQKKQKKEVST